MSKNKPCHCCNGTGDELDDAALGRKLRNLRTKAGVGLREMSRALSISHSFLSQLESGNRRWTPETSHLFIVECEKAQVEP